MGMELAGHWYLFVMFGLVAGFVSSLFGVGGGIVLVPLLIMIAGQDPNTARGTSLAYMVGTAFVGAVTWHYTKDVKMSFGVIGVLTVAGIVGTFGGYAVARCIEPLWTKRLLAGLMIFAAIKLFLDAPKQPKVPTSLEDNPPKVSSSLQ